MHFSKLSILSFFLLVGSTFAKTTTIGLETPNKSRAVHVPLGECQEIDEDEVYTVAISKKCRFFRGPVCTGPNVILMPGEHTSEDPVPIQSVYCEDK